jgi:L-asparaginase II
MPLRNLAVGFKNLLRGRVNEPDPALARIRDAMQAEPYLVSGERRLDLDLAAAFGKKLVAKSGAEAVLAVGWREPALGIAIKVLDGGERALGPILIEVLKQLGLVTALEAAPTLARHERPRLFNLRKLPTGELVPDFRLERV